MLNIVIPIAGEGSSFKKAGYTQSKPFIFVEGLPMLQQSIWNLKPPWGQTRVIVICLEKDESSCSKVLKDTFIRYNINSGFSYEIISIPEVTQGTACTVLKAEHLINDNDELVIANPDQLILQPDYLGSSLVYYRKYEADGGILCCFSQSPKLSYAKLNEHGVITNVEEKKVISNFATGGVYYYRRGRNFVSNAKCMIAANQKVNNEFYVVPVYNWMIKRDEAVVLPYLVNELYVIGTPEDLKAYESRRKDA